MEAIREEQEENFHSFELDPSRKRHPMVKVQLLSVTKGRKGEAPPVHEHNKRPSVSGVASGYAPSEDHDGQTNNEEPDGEAGCGVPIRGRFRRISAFDSLKDEVFTLSR